MKVFSVVPIVFSVQWAGIACRKWIPLPRVTNWSHV